MKMWRLVSGCLNVYFALASLNKVEEVVVSGSGFDLFRTGVLIAIIGMMHLLCGAFSIMRRNGGKYVDMVLFGLFSTLTFLGVVYTVFLFETVDNRLMLDLCIGTSLSALVLGAVGVVVYAISFVAVRKGASKHEKDAD